MPEFEIKNVLALAVARDGALAQEDLTLIHEQKKQTIQKSGILEMIECKNDFKSVGGLENIKSCLKHNRLR